MLVLDSGGVSRLAERSRQAAALILALREQDLWPPLVPSVVLVACLQGHPGRDALANRFLKTCNIVEEIVEPLARQAALLRRQARRGSAVDALVSSRTPDVTARILDHLGFASAVPPIAPARAPPDHHVRELVLAFHFHDF